MTTHDEPTLASAPEPDTHFIDDVAHPASRSRAGALSARQTITVLAIALLTGALLDSHALVRAGEGMSVGWTRDATLTVAKPLDRTATSIGLDRPREAFDAALHRKDNSGGTIVGSDVPPPLVESSGPSPSVAPSPTPSANQSGPHPTSSPTPTPAPIASDGAVVLRQPTRAQPLRVLVAGDSLSTYVADQMQQLTDRTGLLAITNSFADGTGLSNPAFYNWQKEADLQARAHHPEVVVMVIGGNERRNLTTPAGDVVLQGTDAWVGEYARRVAAIMRTYLNDGAKVIYWSGPPTARDRKWNALYRNINIAVHRAALSVSGARYVDLYNGTAVNGRYADRVPFEGHVVTPSRQDDGIHWTYEGSALPASLELAALAQDLGHSVR